MARPSDDEYARRQTLAERVARVLCAMDGYDPEGTYQRPWGPQGPHWHLYVQQARKMCRNNGWKDHDLDREDPRNPDGGGEPPAVRPDAQDQ